METKDNTSEDECPFCYQPLALALTLALALDKQNKKNKKNLDKYEEFHRLCFERWCDLNNMKPDIPPSFWA